MYSACASFAPPNLDGGGGRIRAPDWIRLIRESGLSYLFIFVEEIIYCFLAAN